MIHIFHCDRNDLVNILRKFHLVGLLVFEKITTILVPKMAKLRPEVLELVTLWSFFTWCYHQIKSSMKESCFEWLNHSLETKNSHFWVKILVPTITIVH